MEKAMKKVLMISPFFIPRRRVGALRAFKFAIHLKEFGFQPAILSIHDKTGRITAQEEELLKGIPLFSITPPFDKTAGGNTHRKGSKSKKQLLPSPAAWIDKNTPMDTWIYLFLLRYPSIRRFAKEWDPEIIWATGDPWSSLWLGHRIARYLKRPFVADFRDPWIPGEISLRQRSPFSQKADRSAELSIIKDADRLVFTSRQTELEYRKYYQLDSASTTTIYNSRSFLLEEVPDQVLEKPLFDREKFILLFFGRFRALSPVQSVIEMIRLLKSNEGRNTISLLEVHSYGKPDPEQLERIRDAGLEEQFVFHKPLPPGQGLSQLNEADLLLLTTHKDRRLVIPAKLWDYLYACPEILSITPNPEIGEIIDDTKRGFHTTPDQIGLAARYLAGQIKQKMKTDRKKSRAYSEAGRRFDNKRYESKETTRKLAKLFDDVLRGRDAT